MAQPITKDELLALPVEKLRVKTGDLYFCHGGAIGSYFIQWATKSLWSHCGIVWVPQSIHPIEPLFIEAVEYYGVRVCEMEKYTTLTNGGTYDGPTVVVRRTNQISDVGTEIIIEAALNKLTDPYSLLDLASLAGRLTFGLKRRPTAHSWICSEFVSACLNAGGHRVHCRGNFVTPAELWADPNIELVGRIA